MKKIIVYIISIITLGLLISCGSECYVQQMSSLSISFLDSTTYKAKNISGLTVIGLNNDSILYNNRTLSSVQLPLHFNETHTVFRFILPTRVEGNTVPDTILLKIDHTPKPQLVSKECGCVMFHTLHDAKLINNTYNFKLQITNTNVVNDGQTTSTDKKISNIKILH